MTAHTVTPRVYVTGEMKPNMFAIYSYLQDIGVTSWDFVENKYHGTDDAEKLIEFAGRLCYKSFGTGLNPNITKVRDDPNAYVANILESGHGSVLEHIHIQFTLHNVSRVLTHELVRHRHGNFSQESMRYVRLDNIPFVMPRSFGTLLPPSLKDASDEQKQDFWDRAEAWFGAKFSQLGDWQTELAEMWEIDQIKDFHTKKLLTSDFRRLAPQGVATEIIWTTNLREARHVIAQRTSEGAETEIREVFGVIAEACAIRYPKAFADMTSTVPDSDPFKLKVYSFGTTKV